MKQTGAFFIIFIIGLTFKAKAQDFPIDPTTKKIAFVGVVPAEGMTRSALFDRALVVLHRMYKEADTKISVKDKDNGVIVVKGFTQLMEKLKSGVMNPNPQLVLYTLTISFKDGKYRYEFTDFVQNRAGAPNNLEEWIEHHVPDDHYYSAGDHIQHNLNFPHAN